MKTTFVRVTPDMKLMPLLSALAVIITVLTPVATVAVVVTSGSGTVPATVLAVYVCLLATGLLALLAVQERSYRRDARYAMATIRIRAAYEALADASWIMIESDRSQEMFHTYLRESLRYLADAFHFITGSECRTSIKMLVADDATTSGRPHRDSDVRVVTVCRHPDVAERPHLEPDRVGNNTDFRQILAENRSYFFSNDLLAARQKLGYTNSHWDEETIRTGSYEYTAAIVWPIARSRPPAGETPARRKIVGFLCVDTLVTGAFSEAYDVPIGAAFANALHLTLYRYGEMTRHSWEDDRQ